MNVEELIADVSWEEYCTRVHCCVLDAFSLYRLASKGPEPPDPMFQVAIWTDIQACVTAVDIETLAHAQEAKAQLQDMLRESGNEDGAREDEARPYNSSPADFLYTEYRTISHPELKTVQHLASPVHPDRRFAIESAIEAHLLTVVSDLNKTKAFHRIPREPRVWVGVSSPRDWYDHVRAV